MLFMLYIDWLYGYIIHQYILILLKKNTWIMKRDTANGKIAGVCAGLAQEFNADQIILKAIFLLLFFGLWSGKNINLWNLLKFYLY